MRSETRHYHDLEDGTSLELPVPMSSIMEYKDVLVQKKDGKITIGYLVDDSDCQNPLTDCDGMGWIYEARRHGPTLSDYEQALGLSDGGPNLELVDEDEVVKSAVERILLNDDLKEKAVAHCLQYWELSEFANRKHMITQCLDSINELEPVINIYDLQLELWKAGRREGRIGDKHAVLIDVHEHGQVHYRVNSGGGADWDVARAGAVWVPDNCARDELLRRATTYRKGYVSEMQHRGETWYEVMLWASPHSGMANSMPGGVQHASWGDAFNALSNVSFGASRPQEEGEAHAARELAAQACSTYTDWCNGNTFGVCVVTYDDQGVQLEENAVYGFIGDDDAYSSLKNDYFPQEEK